MSEEVLIALMQLFAIIAKQDEGVEATEITFVQKFLSQQLSAEAAVSYFDMFNTIAEDEKKRSAKRLTSTLESVRMLNICRKLNKTLNQKQKIVVLVRLFELVNASKKFTDQRMMIINTAAEVFNVTKEEFLSVETFVKNDHEIDLNNPHILIINGEQPKNGECKRIVSEVFHGNVIILQIRSSELYFLRYTGKQDILLNGLILNNSSIYLLASGSTIKLPKGKPVYYSDVVSKFLQDLSQTRLSYNIQNISYRFSNGTLGLRNISFSETQGHLVGIMGASGAGKTTLLNVLSGINEPTSGQILINGVNLHKDKEKIEGVIGYIPQDDLLIEELTVYENLYFNAKFCFKDTRDEEIKELVDKTLISLGLYERKDLQVGSVMNKKISGGQRKRLNIALELIREPSILFVDEPTSGLSSRDSENVMDLLSELSLKGKLIFVVIHQPSSDIYKMFDRMVILDQGGYLVYYGNPVEAIVHFKKLDNQINYEVGECPNCGNVTPEQIFNIIEARVVDEFGRYTEHRKVLPERWEKLFHEKVKVEKSVDETTDPPKNLNIPSWFQQFQIYTLRDFLSKISNTQYIVLNLLEAPLLGFILSFIIRYTADPEKSNYVFRFNENIPPYIFMSIVVALFLGLTVSAEEIFRDRKILKREAFLNLSRSSYLLSKVVILISISALQAFLYVMIGNTILGLYGMYFDYWLVLFATFVMANMLGLNISSSFNSAVTIYILIPLVMIPMMALGGAMFSFDKLNSILGTIGRVPLIAEFMPSRWAYESLMVHQFKDNQYEQHFYKTDKVAEVASYKQTYYTPKLIDVIDEIDSYLKDEGDSILETRIGDLDLLRHEFKREEQFTPKIVFKYYDKLDVSTCDSLLIEQCREHVNKIREYYSEKFNVLFGQRDIIVEQLEETEPDLERRLKLSFHNESLQDIVYKSFEKYPILRYKHELVAQYRPIYFDPEPRSFVDFRTHFYAPQKYFMGKMWDTFYFNIFILWVFTIGMYGTLYYNLLKKLVDFFGDLKLTKLKQTLISKSRSVEH
jgi:ABC-type multidrug transport system ATPase subunit